MRHKVVLKTTKVIVPTTKIVLPSTVATSEISIKIVDIVTIITQGITPAIGASHELVVIIELVKHAAAVTTRKVIA